ncbi:MAG: hypothetical protein ACR2O6_05690 [Ilumatobacteraceae bacterium]
MTNAAIDQRHDDGAEQLTLLPASNVSARFMLSRETRERGLRHVAEIRRQLAAQAAQHADDNVHTLHPRHPEAA